MKVKSLNPSTLLYNFDNVQPSCNQKVDITNILDMDHAQLILESVIHLWILRQGQSQPFLLMWPLKMETVTDARVI
jgi:hypothetical protein